VFKEDFPDEYAKEPGDPVSATLATVPFNGSVNPRTREQTKSHIRDNLEERASSLQRCNTTKRLFVRNTSKRSLANGHILKPPTSRNDERY
jgi:hypothetical protein